MNELAVIIGVILFPGLIAAVICDKLVVHTVKWDTFKYGIYSFIFGVLSYVLLQAIYLIPLTLPSCNCAIVATKQTILNVWTIVKPKEINISLLEVFYATLLAPIVAALSASIVNFKLINKLAKLLNISRKYGDENLYSFFLNSDNVNWVYVRDIKNNLTYEGKVVSFSETDSMQELVLSDVTLYAYETSKKLYSIPVIYMVKPMGEFIIETVPSEFLEKDNGKETA